MTHGLKAAYAKGSLRAAVPFASALCCRSATERKENVLGESAAAQSSSPRPYCTHLREDHATRTTGRG